jgi:hypothetical protein
VAGLLVLASGCNLKFPGPHFNIDGPDAAAFGNFAGNGGGALSSNSNPVSGPVHTAQVIDAKVSVAGKSPVSCPPGQLSVSGSCRLRTGVAKQCANGGSLCPGGGCCAAGLACAPGGGCVRAPGGSSSALPGMCASGQLATSASSNCPPLSQSNAIYLDARCCPSGAALHCTDPNDASTAVCMQAALLSPTCPSGYALLTDTVNTATTGCCPSSGGTVHLTSGSCFYTDVVAPQCAGALDPATGACCDGTLTTDGRCCPFGKAACGSGCCEQGESCDSSTGQCRSPLPAATPMCPPQSPTDCSAQGGQCCPADGRCQSDGTCSCPASTPVDCGGFCAASTEQCACPPEHPDACGAECCLAGGCGGGGLSGSCGCPSGTTTCGENCCPAGSMCQAGQCLGCPSSAPTLCGSNCCGLEEMCVGGQCVGCSGDAPVHCGSTCCRAGETCNGNSCVPMPSSSPPTASPDAGAPHVGGSSGGGSSGGGMPNAGAGSSCMPVPAPCSACTVTACASASSAGTCHTWYTSSDGRTFECAGCGDCVGAAQAAVQHCCPVHP